MMELISIVKKALDELYQGDADLLDRQVHERSIVFRFGLYFYELLKNSSYSKLDLDFDYNRNMCDSKRTPRFPDGIYPDLILHKRRSNRDNILALEFKTYWNKSHETDIYKLRDLTNPQQQYRFKLGIAIILGKRREKCLFTYVQNGEEVNL
jgi:hypothetical protein